MRYAVILRLIRRPVRRHSELVRLYQIMTVRSELRSERTFILVQRIAGIMHGNMVMAARMPRMPPVAADGPATACAWRAV